MLAANIPSREFDMHTRVHGLSLIELMLALAILATLLSMAMPGATRLRDGAAASAASNAILAALNLARNGAIGHGRPAVLCPSSDGVHCTGGSDWSVGILVFIDRNRDRARASDEPILQVVQAVSLRAVRVLGSHGRLRIVYHPDGRAAGSNLRLRLCTTNGLLVRGIVVGNSGRARVEQTDAGTPCP